MPLYNPTTDITQTGHKYDSNIANTSKISNPKSHPVWTSKYRRHCLLPWKTVSEWKAFELRRTVRGLCVHLRMEILGSGVMWCEVDTGPIFGTRSFVKHISCYIRGNILVYLCVKCCVYTTCVKDVCMFF